MKFRFLALVLMAGIQSAFTQGAPQILWSSPAHSYRVNSIAVTPDGTSIVSAGLDNLIKFWNLADGTLIKTFNTNSVAGLSNQVLFVAVSPNGSLLAAANFGATQILRASDGAAVQTLSNADWIIATSFSPDGSLLATGGFDTTVQIWNTSNWSLRSTLQATNGQVRSVAFSPTSPVLAIGYGNSQVVLWNASTGTLLRRLTGHSADVDTVAFSPDGLTLASGSEDGTIKLWDAISGSLLQTLTGHGNFVYGISFSPDGKNLVSCGGLDNTIKLWRVADGALLRNCNVETTNVTAVAFSPGANVTYGRVDGMIFCSKIDYSRVESMTFSANNSIFQFTGTPNRQFTVQSSDDLKTWTSLVTNTFSTSPVSFATPRQSGSRFYRTSLLP